MMMNKEMLVNGELLDKLIQKTVDFMGDVSDLNILVRRLPGSAEALAGINARIDATQFAMKEIERSIAGTAAESQEIRKAIEGMQKTWKEMKAAVEELPGKISIPSEKIDGLRQEMAALTAQLLIPLEKRVVHHHHLSAYWVITLILSFTSTIFIVLYFNR